MREVRAEQFVELSLRADCDSELPEHWLFSSEIRLILSDHAVENPCSARAFRFDHQHFLALGASERIEVRSHFLHVFCHLNYEIDCVGDDAGGDCVDAFPLETVVVGAEIFLNHSTSLDALHFVGTQVALE